VHGVPVRWNPRRFQRAFAQAPDSCAGVHDARAVALGDGSSDVGSMPESTCMTMQTAAGVAKGALAPGYGYTLAFRCE
jgi:hypothetical protein